MLKKKNSQKKRMKLPQLDKKHLKTYTASIIIYNKKLNYFPLILGARMFTVSTVFNTVLEVLTSAMRQKEIKGVWITRKEIKLPLFVDDMIVSL